MYTKSYKCTAILIANYLDLLTDPSISSTQSRQIIEVNEGAGHWQWISFWIQFNHLVFEFYDYSKHTVINLTYQKNTFTQINHNIIFGICNLLIFQGPRIVFVEKPSTSPPLTIILFISLEVQDHTKFYGFRMIHVKDSLLPRGKVWSTWTSWVYKFLHQTMQSAVSASSPRLGCTLFNDHPPDGLLQRLAQASAFLLARSR